MTTEHVDVLVIGAGISGICSAYYLQKKCPNKTYMILEGRSAIGGTWDLFRYPGIRSDSDMYTLGFSFNPWLDGKAISDGETILNYVRDTADKFGIKEQLQKLRNSDHTVLKQSTGEDNCTTGLISHSCFLSF